MRALCCCGYKSSCCPSFVLSLQQQQRRLHSVRAAACGSHALRRCGTVGLATSTSAMHARVRWHSTTTTPPTTAPGGNSGAEDSGTAAAAGAYPSSSATAASTHRTLRTVRLHNMPRTWMHEEVVQFLHHVAEHAGITPPTDSATEAECQEQREGEDGEEGEEDTTSAVPYVTSPFVARMRIPFGRRTGIVYGAPVIRLTSNALTDYLLRDLKFDPDDYRGRIYFTEVTGSEAMAEAAAVTTDEAAVVRMEQQQALDTLELDRYLLAPDLLYDIAKMRQRRLVTRQSKLLLHTFTDDDNDDNDIEGREADWSEKEEADATNGAQETGAMNEEKKKRRKGLRCAGDYKELGRGSMHSIPLPTPYVQGRRGT
ncbi:hypothetical protein DQ04_06221020 [Trypanosoma grayi]|uniref:hypothetical protein n=1 Tax=Trypanosoma grayi TaxID=71804 RepID=UPI0004F42405|nr:hypothetical protein DQ04_06221020 [Trypanosoma grayi]KEG08900.1 hypothetical protein DQ04_06221020 [Trypanosoma grayi]